MAAGSALICLLPVAAWAAGADGLALRLSAALDAVGGQAPAFQEDSGPDLALSLSRGTAVIATPWTGPAPQAPSRPTEYPLRLAQVLLPPSGPGRQPRWSSRYDNGLGLMPSRNLGFPGAVPGGRMPPPGVGPAMGADPYDQDPVPGPGMVPGMAPGQDALGLRPPAPFPAAPAPAAEDSSEGGGLTGWAIPPIRWMGSVGYSIRQNTSSDKSRTLDQVFNANIRASSYIYAPWFSQVSGSLGLVSGSNNFSSGTGLDTQTRNNSLVGSANLDLFPSSRFPFNANFSRSDSRTANQVLASSYTETRFGVRQSYRSEDNRHNGSGGLDYSVVDGQSGVQDTVTALYGSYSTALGGVNNSMNARYSVSDRQGTGEGTSLFSINSSHTYNPQDNIAIQAFSNITDNTLRYNTGGAGGVISQYRGQFIQLGTAASWRPEFEDDEDQPLTLNGGVTYADSRTSTGNNTSQSQRLTGTTSAYYRFSPNFSVNGSGTVNYMTDMAGSRVFTLVNSAANYSGDPLTIGNFSYNWNTGGNLSWQGATGNTGSNVFTAVQAGHSLSRNFSLSNTDSISLSLAQNAAMYQNQMVGASTTLSHSAMSSYRLAVGERFNGSVNTTFSDVMTNGASSQHYQTLGVGFNGFGQLSPRSSATVNLSFNWADQTQKIAMDSTGQQITNQRMTLVGNASYTHTRFATIPGLRYTFLFTADSLLRDDRLMGDPNAQYQRNRYSVDNRLDYRIGMLDLRASAIMNDTGGKKNALLFFQVTRQIGAY